ncbi:MAG: stage II sporulation protein M [Gemmatimonadales bacterium]
MALTPRRADYRQHLEVETPEHVVLDYEIAGIGSRTLAALLDWVILTIFAVALLLTLPLARELGRWLPAAFVVLFFALVYGYFSAFEGLWRGQTPGKRWMGIRVIRDTGHPVTLPDAAARNLLLPVDLFAFLGVFLIAIHPRAKRLGDLVAGTVVVRDHPVVRRPVAEPSSRPAAEPPGPPELTDPEFRLLREFVHRAPDLPPAARSRHTRTLTVRFADRSPDRPPDDWEFLQQLYRDELARRQGRFGARAIPVAGDSAARRLGGSGLGARPGASTAERLVARKQPRWDAFQAMAERVSRRGLDALEARELPEFAAGYREVAADLARARTYGADAATLGFLERLVAAGHNALYRTEQRTWRRIVRFVAQDCPAAVVGAGRYVALAAVLFLLPALAGYALLRERPELAPELLPDVVLERAEAGVARQAAGQGYVVDEPGERPFMASAIITNNVRVAFACFAGGIALGVGALLLLAFNGLFLGAVSGHFANAGLLGYLWTFVIGHGVLELFAIWVAGAAGFRLGQAIIAPGDLARRDAVVLAGRRAIRMIGAVVVMLAVAGLVEGFVSAGEGPLALRIGVSSGTVLFLALYLWQGARFAERRVPSAEYRE